MMSQPGISRSEKAHYSKVYGINQVSIITELMDFDVTKQLPQDLMHVILEGIYPLHMEQFLEYIVSSGIMTLDEVNSQLSSFPYSYFHEKPSYINTFDIQGTQSGMFF